MNITAHLVSSAAQPRPLPPVPSRRSRPAGARLLAGLALALTPWLAAQPDCRSVLGANFKRYTPESQFSWAGELVTIPSYQEDRYANNSMLFGGIDFTSRSKQHQFYVEGGVKRSTVDAASHGVSTLVTSVTSTETAATEVHVPVGTGRPSTAGTGTSTGTGTGTGTGIGTATGAGTTTTTTTETSETGESGSTNPTTQTKYGWREIFYQYRAENLRVRAGLSTTRLGDYFLVNERVLGLSYSQQLGAATLSAAAGSVGDFARMTDFCGTKRLTNLVDKEKYETVGEDFGDTNMAGAVVTWDLTRPAPAVRPGPKAGADEFAMSDDLAPRPAANGVALRKVGLLAYHEYDRVADENRTWLGALAQLDLPRGFTFKFQGMYQDGHADALILYGLAEKEYYWSNASNTAVHVGYFGKYNIGGRATFESSFSNLFKGEIMRMDAIDIPLVFAGIRHNFASRRKLYVQLQGIEQLQAENMKEVDLEVGADVFKHVRVAAIGSYIYSRVTKQPENYVAKVEVRVGF